jgi:hypothetical protein
MWHKDFIMPHFGGSAVLILLCLLAGFAALAGLSSAVAVLLFGIGLAGMFAALGFGVVATGAGLWAAVLAFGIRPAAS